MSSSEAAARDAIERLDQWVRSANYAAYDPFDGLNAWVRPLAIGALGRQLLQQGVKRFPWNLRPVLGIRPSRSSKGMGYFARGYLKLFATTGDEGWREDARFCLEWLTAHPSLDYEGLSWGNHFDYQSRVFYLPEGEPTVVWTAHIGFAFLDAWEFLGEDGDLEAAQSVCEFILNELERRPEGGGVCISYVPGSYHAVHNASMLAAAALARTYAHTGQEELRQVASDAVAYTVHAQRDDGSWWYGEAENLRWVDNFHTGYVLDCLWWYMVSIGDQRYQTAFDRGARYFVENFFLDDGTPKYYPNRTYPIDIQCAAQSIETLVLLARHWDPSCRALAEKVARWTIANMQDSDGYFYFQRGRRWVNKTPMLHWGQATMFHALACLLEVANDAD
jgi:hypothetical protein